MSEHDAPDGGRKEFRGPQTTLVSAPGGGNDRYADTEGD